MTTLVWIVGILVVLGTVLAAAESSLSRMTRVRALALEAEGRRNAGMLARIQHDPASYLNAVYLAVMLVQNGSAILVAILAQQVFGNVGVTVVSAVFTLCYFVVVEAMAKTFGVLHTDRAALALAPIVVVLGRLLSLPTRGLITLANVLLPGKGLPHGPFVTEEEIRTMAELGHEEGVIDSQERELIHAAFTFGDTVVREVMVPRPDVIAIDVSRPLADAIRAVVEHGHSRIPVYRDALDHVEGVVYVKDLLRHVHEGRTAVALADVVRQAHFVPESKRVADLLKDMQRHTFHMAVVTDEYGSVCGVITLEDLLEELVGEIADEWDQEEPELQACGDGVYRVAGSMPIRDLAAEIGVALPSEDWDTVGGLMLGLLGAIPRDGQEVRCGRVTFTAEKVQRRRVLTVLVTVRPADDAGPAAAPA